MGYSIEDLKKAGSIAGEDALVLQQGGITKQIARSVMDQAVIVTASGAQSTGSVRKEGTYVLQNNSAEIRLTINNAIGKSLAADGSYTDSAAAAAGWILKIINNSTRNHTVISGANSWAIAAGEIQEYYWTGSAWTFHNVVTESRLNNALANLYNTKKKLINGTTGDYQTHWVKLFSTKIGKQYDSLDVVFDINFHALSRGGNVKGFLTAYTQTASNPFVYCKTDKLVNSSQKLKYGKTVNSDGTVTISVYCPTLTDNYIFFDVNTTSNKDITFASFEVATDISSLVDIDNEIATISDLSDKATWKARKTFATDRTPLDIQLNDILVESIVIFDSGSNFGITMAQFRGQQVSITRVAGTSSISVTDIGNHVIRITPTADYVRVGVLAY